MRTSSWEVRSETGIFDSRLTIVDNNGCNGKVGFVPPGSGFFVVVDFVEEDRGAVRSGDADEAAGEASGGAVCGGRSGDAGGHGADDAAGVRRGVEGRLGVDTGGWGRTEEGVAGDDGWRR
ncbi:hypothetical protein ACFX2C_040553 [Malus domestica]